MYRLAIGYILFAFTLVGLCCFDLDRTRALERSKVQQRPKEAITRYISSSHFQFNSIVISRESGIFCLVLF
jgi:hypothetical protein